MASPFAKTAPALRALASVTFAGLLACCAKSSGSTKAVTGPNVVLVVVDTLRSDHLSDYGYERATSSGIALLSSRATRFSRCFAPTPWTVPSTASVLTGLDPMHHRSQTLGVVLNDDLTTVAEVFAANGYRTAAFSANKVVSNRWGFAQGFDTFADWDGEWLGYPDVRTLVTGAEDWIGQHAVRPFFVYLHPMNCHGPYKVPAEQRASLLGREPSARFEYDGPLMTAIMKKKLVARRADFDAVQLESLVEQYDTAIRYTLDELGGFFSHLDAKQLFDDALVIVTADHGEELFDHQGLGHGYSLYRELLAVPLYVKLPRQRRPQVLAHLATLADLLPTIADASGIPIPFGLDGRSLVPAIEGRRIPSERGALYFETRWRERCSGTGVLVGRHTLLEIETNYEGLRHRQLLFDNETDPGQTRDIGEREHQIAARLGAMLALTFGPGRDSAAISGGQVRDDRDEEALRRLGYLDEE